jgi:hypothetical protein
MFDQGLAFPFMRAAVLNAPGVIFARRRETTPATAEGQSTAWSGTYIRLVWRNEFKGVRRKPSIDLDLFHRNTESVRGDLFFRQHLYPKSIPRRGRPFAA